MRYASMLAVAVLGALCAGALHGAVEVGDMGPNFKFEKSWNTPDGFTQLDDYRGKIVMVERWATT